MSIDITPEISTYSFNCKSLCIHPLVPNDIRLLVTPPCATRVSQVSQTTRGTVRFYEALCVSEIFCCYRCHRSVARPVSPLPMNLKQYGIASGKSSGPNSRHGFQLKRNLAWWHVFHGCDSRAIDDTVPCLFNQQLHPRCFRTFGCSKLNGNASTGTKHTWGLLYLRKWLGSPQHTRSSVK